MKDDQPEIGGIVQVVLRGIIILIQSGSNDILSTQEFLIKQMIISSKVIGDLHLLNQTMEMLIRAIELEPYSNKKPNFVYIIYP